MTVALRILVALACLVSVAGILTIGAFTLPLAAAGAVILIAHPGRLKGVALMLSALATDFSFEAWSNREGPGRVCLPYPDTGLCGNQLNPWLWLGGAAVSMTLAVALFLRARRRLQRPRQA